MGIKQNTWMLDEWYAQEYANPATYEGAKTMWAWGRNESGQLGLNTGPGDQGSRSSPTQIGTLQTWKSISYGAAIRSDNTLWCWGNYSFGQLGNNKSHPSPAPNRNKSSPVQVPGSWSTAVGALGVAQSNYRLAMKTDGTMWGWGSNGYGQLGQNNRTNRSSPVQINGSGWGTGYMNLACDNGVFSIKTDGTLWALGGNGVGTLGVNDTNSRSSPVQVGTDTNWNTVSTRFNAVIATKTDGSLWGWGNNDIGQLGQNDKTNYSSPKQIPGTWSNGTAGYSYTIATKTDGTLWAWGWNGAGALGNNQAQTSPSGPGFKAKSSPVQIGSNTNWDKPIQAFHYTGASGAFKTDGSLWMWGDNGYGEGGGNDTTQRSSPTQVPGNWSSVVNLEKSTIGLKEL
tara:strand:- start:40 stop:1233 length:1194 start_codon:yes stop_codon:yes gene_type:complete